ncbi:hypothetical protein TNCV_1621901 [Trichonephila clavipes]|nr:hypothetical protein TNCV_1621901 [Trichonephila clavipes]
MHHGSTSAMHHGSTSAMQQVIITGIVRICGRVQLAPRAEGFSGTFKQIRCAGDVSEVTTEVTTIHAVKSCPVATGKGSKRFQGAPEEEMQGVGVRVAWRQSNTFTVSNPLPEICSSEMITLHIQNKCCCTIVHELHVLVRSGRYSLQQLWEDVLSERKVFWNIEAFCMYVPSSGSSPS